MASTNPNLHRVEKKTRYLIRLTVFFGLSDWPLMGLPY